MYIHNSDVGNARHNLTALYVYIWTTCSVCMWLHLAFQLCAFSHCASPFDYVYSCTALHYRAWIRTREYHSARQLQCTAPRWHFKAEVQPGCKALREGSRFWLGCSCDDIHCKVIACMSCMYTGTWSFMQWIEFCMAEVVYSILGLLPPPPPY